MRKLAGWILFAVGAWMLVSPQALIGLKQLQWMHKYSFSGEVLVGIVVLSVAYFLLDFKDSASSRSRLGTEPRASAANGPGA